MMMGFDGVFGWLGILWSLAGIALLVGIVLVVVWAIQRAGGGPEDEALNLLRARFARGEIDAAQYGAMAQVLRSERPARRPEAIGAIGLVLVVVAIVAWLVYAAFGAGPWRSGWDPMIGPGGMMGTGGMGPEAMMGLGPGPTAPVGISVRMAGTRFDPSTLRVRVGETVRWFNDDALPHTVTAGDQSWGSGNLNPGASFERRFDSPGTYPYLCVYHPGMIGTIVVAGR